MSENGRSDNLAPSNASYRHFDLLGFCRLVGEATIDEIIPTYEEVVQEIEEQAGAKAPLGVSSSWFSDTFILFSRHGTDREFAAIEQAGRLFFQKLVFKDIPVRGAMTFGKLYSRVDKNIFIGPALIDAYKYGEAQDWIGFILTPSVYLRCRGTILDLESRLHYRRVGEGAIIRNLSQENVYAFAFNNGSVGGRNPYLAHIRTMREAAGFEHRRKYDNTEAFLCRGWGPRRGVLLPWAPANVSYSPLRQRGAFRRREAGRCCHHGARHGASDHHVGGTEVIDASRARGGWWPGACRQVARTTGYRPV